MRAIVLERAGGPMRPRGLPGQVLVEVSACGVCRTDLPIPDGELGAPKLPLVSGHEIVVREAGVRRQVELFPLEAANEALARLRAGKVLGACVLAPGADGGRR